jgi:hypothetical protein
LVAISAGHAAIYTKIEKPKNYEKMLSIIKVLAKLFPYVRVDLYDIKAQIYFGEITFGHVAGMKIFPLLNTINGWGTIGCLMMRLSISYLRSK